MADPMPKQAPDLMRQQAELTDLRWVALHLLQEHARGARPHDCLCPICRAARQWVPMPGPGTLPGVAVGQICRR